MTLGSGVAKGKVLLVSDARSPAVLRVLRRAGYEVVITYTVDHAVAVCVTRQFAAVILEQELFVEVDGWSVAQSIKLVRADQRVLLIIPSNPADGIRFNKLPQGVDGVIAADKLQELPAMIQ